ncbi:MAG TPA: protein-tyrosine phosphatase family protein [Candidatus Limnocylindria bacterium]
MPVGEHGERPLRVDWLDRSSLADGRTGRIGLTFLPGKHGPSFRYPGRVYRRDVDEDLASLAADGVTVLVLLVEDHELQRWGDPGIVELAAGHGITVERRPLVDGTAPASVEEMRSILALVQRARDRGDVAVACMGGVGRTGTVAACALVDAGWTAADAIAEVRRVRHPTAVETVEQVAFVEAFAHRDR